MALVLLTPPAAEPVSLADAKAWLRIDGSDADALLSSLIQAARQAVEAQSGAALLVQQWKWTLDAWPSTRILVPPIGPLRSLDAVQVAGAAGVLVAVPSASFQVDAVGARGRIAVTGPVPAPATTLGGIVLTVKVGLAATPADVPPAIRQALLITLAHLHEGRGDAADADGPVPPPARALLAPWRQRRL